MVNGALGWWFNGVFRRTSALGSGSDLDAHPAPRQRFAQEAFDLRVDRTQISLRAALDRGVERRIEP